MMAYFRPLRLLFSLPLSELQLVIGSSTMPKVEEDLELGALKGAEPENMKSHQLGGDRESEDAIIQLENSESMTVTAKD
jgi:hypothetical protein